MNILYVPWHQRRARLRAEDGRTKGHQVRTNRPCSYLATERGERKEEVMTCHEKPCGLPACEKRMGIVYAIACQSQVGDDGDYCEVEFCSVGCEQEHECDAVKRAKV